MPVRYEITGKVALVTFDNPPLNVFGQAMRAGLQEAIERARADRPDRMILTGAGRAFVAGADAKEFDGPPLAPQLNDVLAQLVSLPFPTIAAITGAALGGGLEIALACRYRIASPSASLGLPEVTLGIVPGAGGTQRLPRLIGMAGAVDLIGQGRNINAAEAARIGLVDAVADDPLAAARVIDDATLRRAIVADHRPAPVMDEAAIVAAHALADRRATGQKSPHIAIDLVAASATEPLDSALARERRSFIELRSSDQARALRHAFFSERAAQSRGKTYPAPAAAIASAIVVGGGNMGAAIAYALGSSGIAVHVVETDPTAQTRAEANVGRMIEQGVKRGTLTETAGAALRARFSFGIGYADLPAADLAIEAAFESMDVKHGIFAALQAALPRTTILATNTSYLDVNLLAEGIDAPERFLGLHFFAPAHIMKLLEIVKGKRTSVTTLGAAFALAKRLNKMPVLAGVCDGFIGNRILTRYRQTADILLLEGATPDTVDAAMRGFGMAMGPYEAQDLSGLDIAYANRQRQNLRQRADIRYVPIADRMVEHLKRLGRKTNAGWYDYNEAGSPLPSQAVVDCIAAASAEARVVRKDIPTQVISEQILLAMIAESFDILAEGIAARPADIDLVLVHGYGFPRWRGGPMHYADQVGLPRLLLQIEDLAATDPLTWAVPSLLRELVTNGQDLQSLNA
jgi:3-hydroxyacyl-CoA dehydrogenase